MSNLGLIFLKSNIAFRLLTDMLYEQVMLYHKIPWTEEPWRAIVHGVTKSQTLLKRLSIHTHPMAAWPGQGLEQKVMCLIHVLDWTQIPPIIHEFLTLIIRWSRQEDCEGVSTHSSLLPEKKSSFMGHNHNMRTDYYLYNKPMIICFGPRFTPKSFNLFLDDAGIIRNSFPISSLLFYLAWNNKASKSFTISWLHVHLFIFFLITAETARVGLLSKLKENMSISGCV